jgi:hypothetical protein
MLFRGHFKEVNENPKAALPLAKNGERVEKF